MTKKPSGTKSTELTQGSFDYSQFGINSARLQGLTESIKTRFRDSYIAMIDVGNYLIEVKELLEHGEFTEWIRLELEPAFGLTYSKVNNVMNLAKEYKLVQGTADEAAFHMIASNELAAIYRLSTADSVLKSAIYEATSEVNIPSRKSIEQAKAIVRKHNLEQQEITPEARAYLAQSAVAEDVRELQRIERLPKKTQVLVSKALVCGAATSTKEALQQIKESRDPEASTIDTVAITVPDAINPKDFLKVYTGTPITAIKKIPDDTINIAIIEAPLKFEWVQVEFPLLLKTVEPKLKAGGLAIISMGHKAICATYDIVEACGLHVLQPLVLRLQPGRTSTIIGVNIMTASRLALCCFKSPYRQPQGLVVDLQTVGQEEDSQDSVPSGIEAGFEKFLTQFGHAEDVVAHIQLSPSLNFGMRDHLVQTAKSFANQFICVG